MTMNEITFWVLFGWIATISSIMALFSNDPITRLMGVVGLNFTIQLLVFRDVQKIRKEEAGR